MNMDHRPTHLPCNDDHVVDEDGDTAADFYFDDPALLFPLSPTSVLKEIVSLAPSSETGSPLNNRLIFSKIRKTFGNQHQFLTDRPAIKRSSLSPGSEGTQSTTDWMEDEDDQRSCGSLTYSVETDQVLDDLDDDDKNLVASMMTGTVYCRHDTNEHYEEDGADPPKCFRLLDGVITAFQNIFQKTEQPPLIIPDQDAMCASIYEDSQQQNLHRHTKSICSKLSTMKISCKVLLALSGCLAPAARAFVVPRTTPGKTNIGSLYSTTEDSRTESKAATKSMTSATTTPTSKVPVETTVAAVPKVAQRWRKSTKQLSTLGPASSNREMIEKLFLAGADCFRLNYSHGSQEQKKELLMTIREIEEKYSHPIGILGDLQGPKLRVGEFSSESGEVLEAGQEFRLDLDTALGDKTRVNLPHPEIIGASEVGHTLMVDDGKVKLTVIEKGEDYLNCRVDVPGKISNRKGVNTPDSILEISPLTKKDRSDLDSMLEIGVDWVALSFVQTPADIKEIRELIDAKVPDGEFKPMIMAKIEKPSCFDGNNLEELVKLCDGIMVARGDLGVECPPEDVPILQKTIIDECRKQGKPVVVATQMLESMIESPTPTRAEASDVATAIYDGADAIMLSAESAAGKYPEESVAMQQRIINRVENDPHYRSYLNAREFAPNSTPTDAVIVAARQISQTINAKAIVCFSLRGSTVQRASRKRPGVPIMALCPFKETARQLTLSWGVYPDLPKAGSYGYTVSEEDMFDYESPIVEEASDDFDLVLRNACRSALKKGLVSDPDDLLVVTAGLPFGTPGAANVIRIVPAAGPNCWDGLCRVD